MANKDNLLPGDSVRWLKKDEIISASVWCVTPQKVAIRFEHDGVILTKYVDARELQLVYGGRKRLDRDLAKWAVPLKAHPTPVAEPPRELL